MYSKINMIVYLLILIGVILYFIDGFFSFCSSVFKNRKGILKYIISLPNKIQKKHTLKYYVDIFENGNKKDNFVKSSYKLIDDVMTSTDGKNKIKTYKKLCFLCGLIGLCLAMFLKNILLIPVLTLGSGLLPMWLLRFRRYNYTLKLTDELSVALSTISSSYIRCGKIIPAVNENLCYLKNPVKQNFEKFIQNCNINPNIKYNLQLLKNSIDNKVFRLWVDTVIASQEDFNQASSLNAVVEQFTAEKSIYNELKTELQQPIIYYIGMLILTFISFPIATRISNSISLTSSGNIILDTFLGQVLLTAFFIASFWGINKAIKLSTSLDEID